MRDGVYAFRFNGYDVESIGIGYLVGVGTLKLKNDVIVEGLEESSATLLSKKDNKLLPAKFTLSGRFTRPRNGLFKGDVLFKQTPKGSPNQVLEAIFDLVEAGENRYWLISLYTSDLSEGGIEADEIVSGELVRTGALPPRRSRRKHN